MFSDEMKKKIEYAFEFDFNWRENSIPLITQEERDELNRQYVSTENALEELERGIKNGKENKPPKTIQDFLNKMSPERRKKFEARQTEEEKIMKVREEILAEITPEQKEWLFNEIGNYDKLMMPTLIMQSFGFNDPEKYKEWVLKVGASN